MRCAVAVSRDARGHPRESSRGCAGACGVGRGLSRRVVGGARESNLLCSASGSMLQCNPHARRAAQACDRNWTMVPSKLQSDSWQPLLNRDTPLSWIHTGFQHRDARGRAGARACVIWPRAAWPPVCSRDGALEGGGQLSVRRAGRSGRGQLTGACFTGRWRWPTSGAHARASSPGLCSGASLHRARADPAHVISGWGGGGIWRTCAEDTGSHGLCGRV